MCRVGQETNDDAERKPEIGQCKPGKDEVEQVVKCLNVEEKHAASRQQSIDLFISRCLPNNSMI